MSWVRAGTITLTPGSQTVAGAGTTWVGQVLPSSMLIADGELLEIARVVGDAELELRQPYAGAGGAGLGYQIVPVQGYVTEASQLLLQVLESFGDLHQAWLDGSLKGEPGAGLVVRGEVASVNDLPTDPRVGDGWLVGIGLYVWTGNAWFNAGAIRGPIGPANTLTRGTVTTGPAGSAVVISITGEAPAQVIDFQIPRGDKGATGDVTPAAIQARDDAAAAALAASGSADDASWYAGTAAGSASAAAGSADDAAAARDAAQGHADAASASASAAAGSASAASGSAGAAAQSVSDAAAQKAAAQAAASAAEDAAADALGQAVDAAASADAAAASEGLALGYAEAAEGSAADAAASAAVAGIIGIAIDGAGHLILTRADNTTYDAGYVIGPRGEVGASIRIKGSKPTAGDLPASGNDENDAWVVQADGHLHVWDGLGWTDVGQFQGPPGTTDYLALSNRPTLGTAAALDVPGSGPAAAGQVVKGDDPRLSDPRAPTAHTHEVTQISGSTTVGRALMTAESPAAVRAIAGAGTSSFSGAYADLSGNPELGTAAALNAPASGDAAAGEVVKGDDTRLTDARSPKTHTHLVSQISNASVIGINLLTALTTVNARAAIGAGTSNLDLGTTSSTAKPGNYRPERADLLPALYTNVDDLTPSETTRIVAYDTDEASFVRVAPTALPVSMAQAAAIASVPINPQTGTTYTLVLADAGRDVHMGSGSATTVTVPPNGSVALPAGVTVFVTQTGTGQTTIAAGAGVTLLYDKGLKVSSRYKSVALRKTAADTWLVIGGKA